MSKSLEAVSVDCMMRIVQRTATEADLAFIFIFGEFIDSLGGPPEAKAQVPRIEKLWKEAQEAYARGEV